MNELVIFIVVILFPGIVSTIIAERITTHKKSWGALKYAIYSFTLGLFVYAALQIILLIYQVIFVVPVNYSYLSVWEFIVNPGSKFHLNDILFATILSIPFGFFIGAIVNWKAINHIARFFKLSYKYGDENLFSYFLYSNNVDWVYVRDKQKDLTYRGRVYSFSEDHAVQELVLLDVTVFSYEDSVEYYRVPSIYLSKSLSSDGFTIESAQLESLE